MTVRRGLALAYYAVIVFLASGCVRAGRYTCQGFHVRAPIVPVGVQLGPCD